MTTEKFQTAYANLNQRQKEAVDAIDGPVMVIAGPGTGKTQILTLRIANILAKTDTAPENILALTFTESATANMRRRLVELIGSPGYYVEISTFHGFANRLIQEYPEYFPEIIGGRNATDVDQISILRQILEKGDFDKLKPFGDSFFYVDDILGAIRKAKQEGYDPQAFKALVALREKEFEEAPDKYHEKGAHAGKMKLDYQKELTQIEKNKELGVIYTLYAEELLRRRLYDFEDMILAVIKALAEREDFLLQIEEKAQYILVDEHQDTNGAQNRLLELITSFYPNPNLFVVGDEKQAIYRFQGASLENFLYFKNKFPEAKLIYLEDNYRSSQFILDSAQSLIEHNTSTIKAPLTARAGHADKPITIVEAPTPEAELVYLAESIKKLVSGGVIPEEIAVLYRENRDAEAVAEILERTNIPFVVESERDILADSDIKKILKLLEVVADLGNEEKLAEALHIDFLEIPPLDIWRWLANKETSRDIQETIKKIEEFKRWSKNESFLNFFERLIRESGFIKYLLSKPGYFEKISKLNALFDEIKKAVGNKGDYRLEDFMEYLSILREHRVALRAHAVFAPGAVRLMTAHRAKGLEFDHVFIIGAYNGKWGNKRRANRLKLPFSTAVDASELEKNEDERRLFYMALTRARKNVEILWSARGTDGRELTPSQFLSEIREDLKEDNKLELDDRAKNIVWEKPRQATDPKIEDKLFLKEIFRRRGFSVTALNNYLECPWRYFYTNLLRLPQAQTAHQMYGIAAHAALQRFFEARAAGEEADGEYIVARFVEALAREPISTKDRERIEKEGAEVLRAYYVNYAASWNYKVLTEYKVDGVEITPDIILNGKLDKIEFTDTPNEIIVVDYKTRAPLSRNEIEGNTKTSNGNYKRQLVFYKLLLDGDKKFNMRSGVIDFIEPNPSGKFKQESFEISDSEVQELKKEVQRVGEEILELKFWNKTCEEKDCPYCALRAMLAS